MLRQLLPFCGLVAALPPFTLESPAALPPSTLKSPAAPGPTPAPAVFDRVPNPYPDGIPDQPEGCDGQNPDQACADKYDAAGGRLRFAADSGCSDEQKDYIGTALWDATTLLYKSQKFPDVEHGEESAIAYMGPDWLKYSARIGGNIKRAADFKLVNSDWYYITISCKDTKNFCGREMDAKKVGGYAWTLDSVLGWYHYITFCPLYFSLDKLDDKFTDIMSQVDAKNFDKASNMDWLKTSGQFFLHEMMHTRLATGADSVEPHIIDEYVSPDGGGPRAYGAKFVNMLAKRRLNQGGGATRSTTNADSYAMLTNSVFWWGSTGVFPGPPKKITDAVDSPIALHVDLQKGDDPTKVDFEALFQKELEGFDTGKMVPLNDAVDPSNEEAPKPGPEPDGGQ